jgi:hypothetical protein
MKKASEIIKIFAFFRLIAWASTIGIIIELDNLSIHVC